MPGKPRTDGGYTADATRTNAEVQLQLRGDLLFEAMGRNPSSSADSRDDVVRGLCIAPCLPGPDDTRRHRQLTDVAHRMLRPMHQTANHS